MKPLHINKKNFTRPLNFRKTLDNPPEKEYNIPIVPAGSQFLSKER